MNDLSKATTHPSTPIEDCWDFTTDKPVFHVMLTVLPKDKFSSEIGSPPTGLSADGLAFAVLPVDATNDQHLKFKTSKAMAAKASELVKATTRRPMPARPLVPPSPLDIAVKTSCWLLIQLDPAINWQFTVGETPCDYKANFLPCDNTHLRHVYVDDNAEHWGNVGRENCRAIFFGVVRRRKNDSSMAPDPGSCFMNFYIEFLQNDPQTGGTRRLPLIVDPDVKNDGGEEIDP